MLAVGTAHRLLDGHHRRGHAADPPLPAGQRAAASTAPSWWCSSSSWSANVGGCLTPLGDPPLFLGFLHGVSFFWTLQDPASHAAGGRDCCSRCYFVLDTYYYRKEGAAGRTRPRAASEPLKLEGAHNFLSPGGHRRRGADERRSRTGARSTPSASTAASRTGCATGC
ncbi:MAG: sodium:proton antiporter [Desulfobacterales bacterium]|nr:sodium:proton antiporter [Desulfobacterales bacterium]